MVFLRKQHGCNQDTTNLPPRNVSTPTRLSPVGIFSWQAGPLPWYKGSFGYRGRGGLERGGLERGGLATHLPLLASSKKTPLNASSSSCLVCFLSSLSSSTSVLSTGIPLYELWYLRRAWYPFIMPRKRKEPPDAGFDIRTENTTIKLGLRSQLSDQNVFQAIEKWTIYI
eukprot:767340-Hanusia_phi.AAC.3